MMWYWLIFVVVGQKAGKAFEGDAVDPAAVGVNVEHTGRTRADELTHAVHLAESHLAEDLAG